MRLPLFLLKYLLLYKFVIGDLVVPMTIIHQKNVNHTFRARNVQQKLSSFSRSPLLKMIKHKFVSLKSKTTSSSLSRSSSPPKLHFELPKSVLKQKFDSKVFAIQPRQNFWAIPYGALVALNAILAVVTFFLIGIDVAAMIAVSIALPVGIGVLIYYIIMIIVRILEILLKFVYTGGTVVTYGGLHSLLNGRIRDWLLYYASYIQHRLRAKGLKKERLLVYQLLTQSGELWEDFLSLSFEDVQFSMADKKLEQLTKEAERLERYLRLVKSRLNSEKWTRTKCRIENNCDD